MDYFHSQLWYVRPPVHVLPGAPVLKWFYQDTLPPGFSTTMKAITSCPLTKRAIPCNAEPGYGWIEVRDIGVQIITHVVVVIGQIIPVSFLLHFDNHYTQQSTLDLFILCSGIPIAMKHGAFWGNGGWNDLFYFIFSGKALFVYTQEFTSALWKIVEENKFINCDQSLN